MPPSSTTRIIDNEQEQKRIKKRAQNRLSQRCIREKQLIRIHQLERRLSLLEGRGNQDPVAMNAQLLQENEELRDNLQEIRKKLLSIGNMVTTAASSVLIENGPIQLQTPKDISELDQEPLEQGRSRIEPFHKNSEASSGEYTELDYS